MLAENIAENPALLLALTKKVLNSVVDTCLKIRQDSQQRNRIAPQIVVGQLGTALKAQVGPTQVGGSVPQAGRCCEAGGMAAFFCRVKSLAAS